MVKKTVPNLISLNSKPCQVKSFNLVVTPSSNLYHLFASLLYINCVFCQKYIIISRFVKKDNKVFTGSESVLLQKDDFLKESLSRYFLIDKLLYLTPNN
jgi:hypothetical protein